MNNVVLVGRLVKNPEIKYVGNNNIALTTFTIAVDRYTSKQGNQKSDFIEIQTWNRQAEICAKYLSKGRMVGINGQLRIEKYQNTDGETRYYTRVNADNVKFLSSSQSRNNSNDTQVNNKYFDGSNVFEQAGISAEVSEEELPF